MSFTRFQLILFLLLLLSINIVEWPIKSTETERVVGAEDASVSCHTIYKYKINHQISISISLFTTRRQHCTTFLFLLRIFKAWVYLYPRNFPLCHYCHRTALWNAICCWFVIFIWCLGARRLSRTTSVPLLMISRARTNWYPQPYSHRAKETASPTKDLWRVFIVGKS